MLALPSFRYVSPRTLEEASRLIARNPDAVLVSGGTDLYPNMKRLQAEPAMLVSLQRIKGIRGIRGDERRGMVIGANAILADIADSQLVSSWYPALADAAASVGGPQIRNAATLGGNLCQDTRCNYYDMPATWRESAGFCLKKGGDICRVAPGSDRCRAVASSDVAPVAIALGATLRLVSSRGERTIEAKALYRDDGVSYLTKSRDEIVAQMSVPSARGVRAAYLKLRQRGAIDFAILGVAVALRLDGRGVCRHARVVLGAVGSCPLEIEGAEDALVGRKVTEEAIRETSTAAADAARPLDNTALTVQYRKSMVQVYVARALRRLVKKQHTGVVKCSK